MEIRGCLVAAAVLASVPMVASAEDVYPKFTISGGYSHSFADGDRFTDDGPGYFVGIGVPVTKYLNVDFSAFQHFYGEDVAPDVDESGYKADFQFVYSRDRMFQPYVGIGGGYLRSKPDGGDSNGESFFDAGVGFHSYPFSTKVGLLADARYRWMDDDSTNEKLEDVIVRLGLVVPFGDRMAVASTAPTAATKPGKEPEVKALGAERRFADVLFDFDQSAITATGQSTLDNAATTINELAEQYPTLRVKVDGHTDWVGTDGYNQALGERRANAVKQYLERKGVAGDRIDTTSYGESKPVSTNETDEGRALNRRAEVRTTAESE